MTDWKNASKFPPFLNIQEGQTVEVTLLTTSISQPSEKGFSPFILVNQNGVEKNLSLPTVLRSHIERLIESKSVGVGTEFKITRLPKKTSESGKTYIDFDILYKAPEMKGVDTN